MKLVFVSNYMNHHQLPISKELYHFLGDDYVFIQTEPMEEERVKMGWGEDFSALPFMRFFYLEENECRALINQADLVIFGDEKNPEWIQERIEQKKTIIRYTERIYKEGQWKFISPKGLYHKYHQHTKYHNQPMYLLCAGAYVASDFSLIHAYKGKKYQWGYFPEVISYDEESLLQGKARERIEILWTGRMIDWKHPEYPVRLAEKLISEGLDFHLTMIGEGELRQKIETEIKDKKLSEYVTISNFKKPNEIREIMKNSNIYLFTSDYKEGWGAVLNEAMNAACAVVANVAAGSTPFLIKHGINGLVYQNDDFETFYTYVRTLLLEEDKREQFSREAYKTIFEEWNHKVAANRLLEFCKGILDGNIPIFEQGPIAKAKDVKQRKMYQEMTKE